MLGDVILVELVEPFVMWMEFRDEAASVLLVGGSGGSMLGGPSSSGSELANSGGGGIKEVVSKPL